MDGDRRAPLLAAAHGAVHDDVDVGDGEDAPLAVHLALQPLVVHVPVEVHHLAGAQAQLGLELGDKVEPGDGVRPHVDRRRRVAGVGVGDVLVPGHLLLLLGHGHAHLGVGQIVSFDETVFRMLRKTR